MCGHLWVRGLPSFSTECLSWPVHRLLTPSSRFASVGATRDETRRAVVTEPTCEETGRELRRLTKIRATKKILLFSSISPRLPSLFGPLRLHRRRRSPGRIKRRCYPSPPLRGSPSVTPFYVYLPRISAAFVPQDSSSWWRNASFRLGFCSIWWTLPLLEQWRGECGGGKLEIVASPNRPGTSREIHLDQRSNRYNAGLLQLSSLNSLISACFDESLVRFCLIGCWSLLCVSQIVI